MRAIVFTILASTRQCAGLKQPAKSIPISGWVQCRLGAPPCSQVWLPAELKPWSWVFTHPHRITATRRSPLVDGFNFPVPRPARENVTDFAWAAFQLSSVSPKCFCDCFAASWPASASALCSAHTRRRCCCSEIVNETGWATGGSGIARARERARVTSRQRAPRGASMHNKETRSHRTVALTDGA